MTCQLVATITPRVSATDTTFATTPERVREIADCAPITSLFRRETRAPVRVRWKKATGMRCTWSNTWVRRSKMTRSPSPEESHFVNTDRAASSTATSAISRARRTTRPPSSPPVIALTTSPASTGEATPSTAPTIEARTNTMSRAR